MPKIRILNRNSYDKIIDFIENFHGLSIECEIHLLKNFESVDEQTLCSILLTEKAYKTKAAYHRMQNVSAQLLRRFEKEAYKSNNSEYFLQLSIDLDLPPTAVSRILLNEKYRGVNKQKIGEMLKNPSCISNELFAKNVKLSTFCDNQEGPIIDIIRRCIGAEFEIKLKHDAIKAEMVFYDENELRRTGFDKTPDLKLTLPLLYKGNVMNWIESKALFGDLRTHKRYLKEQLISYTNRFGPGMVIYWFGYVEDILKLKENNNLIIMSDFPDKNDLELLKQY